MSTLTTSPVPLLLPAPTIPQCRACPLREGCRGPVRPSGDPSAPVLLVGEAPGRNEDRQCRPFIGPAGRELDNYLQRAGLSRATCRVTNTILCHPPDDRDPTAYELMMCRPWLVREVLTCDARVVGAVGAFACRAIIGADFDLDVGHGIPLSVQFEGRWITVVPIFHPSYGLHSTGMMVKIAEDFRALAGVLHGKLRPEDHQDRLPRPLYAITSPPHMIRHLLRGQALYVDTESQPGGIPWSVQFTCRPGEGWVVLAEDKAGIGLLKEWMERPNQLVVLHHAKYDLEVLRKLDIHPPLVGDSMVAAYLCQKEPQGLKSLAYRKAGMSMAQYSEVVGPYTRYRALEYLQDVLRYDWPKPEPVLVMEKGLPRVKQPQALNTKIKRAFMDSLANPAVDPLDRWHNVEPETRELVSAVLGPLVPCGLGDIPDESAVRYAGRDADAPARVWPQLWEQVVDGGMEDTFWVDMQVTRIVLDMERCGMAVDREKFSELSAYYKREMDRLEGEISIIAGHPLNVGSTLQVADLLYKELVLRCPAYTPKGAPSTDEETLMKLLHDHPIVKPIIDWRGLQKNRSAYAENIPRMIKKDGRVHADIKTTRVYTGRLATAEPNLMAIPIRSEEGRKIRECFITAPGCSLVACDYAQIEMRLAAHASQDKEMLGIFQRGEDIHSQTASKIFGIPVDKVDPIKHRYPAKTCGFGVLYGMSAEGLLDQFSLIGCSEGWTLQKCEALIKEWFGLFRGVRSYFSGKIAEARRYGHVTDLFGRRYLIPEVKSALPHIISAGERQACNYPIQGGAQGVMKRGMVKMMPVYRGFREVGETCNPLIQIHDDMLFEVGDGILEAFCVVYKDTMENAVKLSLPLEVDLKTGKNWGSMEKLK